MKKCNNCGITKSVDNFYWDKPGQRYEAKCKECRRNRMSLHQRLNYNPALRRKRFLEKDKKSPTYLSNWKKRKKLNPEKYKARSMMGNAMRLGKVKKQPCEKCGEVKVEAHHTDYSKPLDVKWLCRKHHKEQHYQSIEALKAKVKITPIK